MPDEFSVHALAALETARHKLSDAIKAYDRAEQVAFDNDDLALAFQASALSAKADELVNEHDKAIGSRVQAFNALIEGDQE